MDGIWARRPRRSGSRTRRQVQYLTKPKRFSRRVGASDLDPACTDSRRPQLLSNLPAPLPPTLPPAFLPTPNPSPSPPHARTSFTNYVHASSSTHDKKRRSSSSASTSDSTSSSTSVSQRSPLKPVGIGLGLGLSVQSEHKNKKRKTDSGLTSKSNAATPTPMPMPTPTPVSSHRHQSIASPEIHRSLSTSAMTPRLDRGITPGDPNNPSPQLSATRKELGKSGLRNEIADGPGTSSLDTWDKAKWIEMGHAWVTTSINTWCRILTSVDIEPGPCCSNDMETHTNAHPQPNPNTSQSSLPTHSKGCSVSLMQCYFGSLHIGATSRAGCDLGPVRTTKVRLYASLSDEDGNRRCEKLKMRAGGRWLGQWWGCCECYSTL